MNNSVNPYQSPEFILEPISASTEAKEKFDRFSFVAWPFVFALNLIVPYLLSSYLTNDFGQIGILGAIALLCLIGWMLCYTRPIMARKLIHGSFVIAMTQFFPLLQIAAGVIAQAIAVNAGLANYGDDMQLGRILSEFGGFVMTLIVGGILLFCASLAGCLLSLILPAKWYEVKRAI